LIDYEGRILGIGVDLGPVSFYHVVEDLLPEFPVQTRLPGLFRAIYVDAAGKTVERDLYVLDPSVSRTRIERNEWIRRWITDHLRRKGVLHEFMVGQAHCWTMDARRLYDELVQLARSGITIYTTADTFPPPPIQ
jgi:aminoglycoside N3'-acetyltransferase